MIFPFAWKISSSPAFELKSRIISDTKRAVLILILLYCCVFIYSRISFFNTTSLDLFHLGDFDDKLMNYDLQFHYFELTITCLELPFSSTTKTKVPLKTQTVNIWRVILHGDVHLPCSFFELISWLVNKRKQRSSCLSCPTCQNKD